MRLRTLLAVSTAGALFAGAAGAPSYADPGAVPDQQAGHVEAWGAEVVAAAVAVPAALGGKRIVSVSASDNATAAVTADGKLFVWGNLVADVVGEAPVGLTDVASVSIHDKGGVAIRDNGSVVGWGTQGLDAPPAGLKASAVAAGSGKGYAIVEGGPNDGTLVAWGDGVDPTPPADLGGDLVDITVAANTVVTLKADGDVRLFGALAALPQFEVPEDVQGQVAQVAGGGIVAGAILNDGSVHIWGFDPPAPPAELDGKTVTALDIYSGNAVAATDEGEIFAWGSNPVVTTIPAAASDGHVAAVTMGANHVATIVTDFLAPSTTTVAVAPASSGYGAARTVTATVAKAGGGATGAVTFNVSGTTGTATVNASGKATWTLPKTLAVGTHNVTASYAGDAATDPSASAAAKVVVTKAASTLKAGKTKVKGKTKKAAKKTTFTLKVSTATGVSPAGTVTIKVKAKGGKAQKATAKVGANGVAKVVLKKLKRGSYTATWTYAGSPTVAGGTVKAKAKV